MSFGFLLFPKIFQSADGLGPPVAKAYIRTYGDHECASFEGTLNNKQPQPPLDGRKTDIGRAL